jgi:hypothetical protein
MNLAKLNPAVKFVLKLAIQRAGAGQVTTRELKAGMAELIKAKRTRTDLREDHERDAGGTCPACGVWSYHPRMHARTCAKLKAWEEGA